MSRYHLAAILLLFTVMSIQTTQSFEQQDPAKDTVIRIGVDLVQVDAIVVDSDDKPVTDLKPEDFSIFQDGKEQKISAFSFISTKSPKATSIAPDRQEIRAEDELSMPPPPSTSPKPAQIRRTIALVVDDLALSSESTLHVRQSLKEWVDVEMKPGDLVAVIRTAVGISALQQFTNDKRTLYAAIDRVTFNVLGARVRTSGFAPHNSLAREPLALDRSQFLDENDRLSTIASLNTIRYVANGLKDIPGRKSLIIFSENMKADFGQFRGDQTVEKRVRDLIESANRYSVVIHIIDPRGVAYPGITAEDDVDYMTAEEIAKTDANRHTALVESQNYMMSITKQTGGLFIRNTNDINSGLKTAVDDGNGYYLIGYQPDASTIEEMTTLRPKLHSIRVSSKRTGLRVRTRSRFFSVPSQDVVSKPLAKKEQIEKALESPFTDEMVPVRLTPVFFQTPEGKPFINALLHFDARKLTFSTIEDNWREANVDLVAATLDADGKQVDIAYKRGTIQARGKTYENMLKSGVAFQMPFPVNNPGAYIMRIVLYDNKSGQLGSATQFVDIPDIGKKELELSGIVLAADQHQYKDFNQKEGVIAYENSNGTAAVRIFESGETIAWACQVLNAKTDSSHKPRLEIEARLFREEQEIFPEKALETAVEAGEDAAPIIATGRITLTRLLPGHYAFQVTVIDMLAGKEHRIAAQSMDFEIAAGFFEAASAPTSSREEAPAQHDIKPVVDMTTRELCRFDPELSHLKFNPSQDELDELLKKIGERVEAFFRDFSNTSSKEKVNLTRSKPIDPFDPPPVRIAPAAFRDEEYNYLILPGSGKAGISWIEDRTDKNNQSVTQKAFWGFFMSSGYAGLCMYLHPGHQANSYFRYLGRDKRKPNAHVIAFAQRPESGDYLAQYHDISTSTSTEIRYLVQGFVWVHPDNFQILRMRTNMLLPEKQGALKKTATDVQYERVQFDEGRREFWLPQRVDISWEFPNWNYRNRHIYSDYQLFTVESDYSINQPKREK